ncbi:nucleotide sugar dehydrogenase [Planktomarina temperata]|nr:nucleotide sugar dehydrogenase [Planktomarina temperata]
MKIVVVGLGYVGLSNAVLLAQRNEVIGVDISQDRVDVLKSGKSPIIDADITEYLATDRLNLHVSSNLETSLKDSDYVIISTPTNYDENTNSFDTSSVEEVIRQVIKHEPNAFIVVKSTIPIGFIDNVRKRFETDAVIFSPEFLREGRALYDNLYPNRIIVGEKSQRAETFAKLLAESALKSDIELVFTGAREAEAIKLFSNAYLAMRVAFFNELDSYALAENVNSREIIDGVSLDPRIGQYYNNPSFGYGGYCLPKDTRQLLANFDNVPQNLISAIINSNSTRKDFLVKTISEMNVKKIGVYRLVMKIGSDNIRESSTTDLLQKLKKMGYNVTIYEPQICRKTLFGCHIERNLQKFKDQCDLIIANRTTNEILDVKQKVFTRNLFDTD